MTKEVNKLIRTKVITEDNQYIENLSLEDFDEYNIKKYWVDFGEPTDQEIDFLESYFHFHPLAIEDCVNTLQRPKLDYYEGFNFLATHIIEEKTLKKSEIDIFIGENFIVTFHKNHLNELENAWRRFNLSDVGHTKWDETGVLYEILDKIVDNYFPLIYAIEDHLNIIDENPEDEDMQELMDQLFDTRAELLQIRQTILPMRDLLYRMLNSTHLTGVMERREYFADIHDHLLKLSDMIHSNREMTADIRDSHLSVNSYQQNRTMMVLTVITVIFNPLTFIAGLYGMNFRNMPELTWKYGYFYALILMVAVAGGLFIWFRKKGWFNK